MKRRIIISLIIIILIILVPLFTTDISKEKDVDKDLPLSIEKLIKYDVLVNYDCIGYLYFNDNHKNIVIEKEYQNRNNDGYFTVAIYSYKGKDVGIECQEDIDENDYMKHLVHKKEMVIDNQNFLIGYSGQDDVEDVNGRAYVRKGDYVFYFSMQNADVQITQSQYDEFIQMIKTVKFKY